MFYAGIGSRETPIATLEEMRLAAVYLNELGFTLRSGGAIGADSAFESGARDAAVIYLPCTNKSNCIPKTHMIVSGELDLACRSIVSHIHPKWQTLNEWSKALHSRNVCQIIGHMIDGKFFENSKFVLFYAPTKKGKVLGGTATAVNLAHRLGIPTINMYDNPNWKTDLNLLLCMLGVKLL